MVYNSNKLTYQGKSDVDFKEIINLTVNIRSDYLNQAQQLLNQLWKRMQMTNISRSSTMSTHTTRFQRVNYSHNQFQWFPRKSIPSSFQRDGFY